MGEQPLHICFLRAYQFQDSSPDICNGIIEGAKKFIEDAKKNHQHAAAGFGKDYCAALCSALRKNRNIGMEKTILDQLPCSRFLKKWALVSNDSGDISDIEYVTTSGLYEGETIIYFAISNKDVSTVEWLLDREKRLAREKLPLSGENEKFRYSWKSRLE
jgi:hypothetical protein